MNAAMQPQGWTHHFDLVVLGSGAAGFAAATTAACRGLSVLVVEKADTFGGTSAISGGAVWVYGTDQARAAGVQDSPDAVRTYLKTTIGKGYRADLVDAYLARGAEALRYLESHSELKYALRPFSPDYYPDEPGATDSGRALEMVEYDGRRLGAAFKHLRTPPPGMLLFGGMMVNRVDIQHFLSLRRSPRSLWHCVKLMARYGCDRLRYTRGTRLTVGNALIARLATTAFEKGVQLWLSAETQSLISENGAITGLTIRYNGQTLRVQACGGVVCAAGGFAAATDAGQRRPGTGSGHLSMSPPNNNGDSLALATAAGARLGEGLAADFFWAPVSQLLRPNGELERFPHLVTDRAKPGIIAVNRAGQRFVNEANSYHCFVQAMQAEGNAPCWLITDAQALNAYGMGLARPKPVDNGALIEAGYLMRADSPEQLAHLLGIDPKGLAATLRQHNADALTGADSQFNKGGNSYNRSLGDPHHTPNPCLAPLTRAPWYAIRVETGDLGSARGLVTDANANVVDGQGQPIPGLYAAGNDMNSIMDGTYPGPGITIGPGLTFGYIAATHIAERLRAGTHATTEA
ncbi:fumarate reductase/succinate dehydrogenase flavoprotein domain-containing protein [Pseudomonas sp. M47T1]|uniref:FAD-dependent oxidoreductase n=1 Tax=unclassified Pseudomonas TaxID=196821 RepID=UPI00026083AA|nr:FAD-dependent oxidoreductase [Pseudomonas sp. M47T1]EIK93638.1 fumarate reductase/succinate dehydrogenase flavoprotein domain-containing protein [Pseudomonas sp. M47T1]